MRHRKAGRKFGKDSNERRAMLHNMVTSLMLHGTIRTTLPRAKELRRHAERVITLGKNAPSAAQIEGLAGEEKLKATAARVHAIRQARLVVDDQDALQKVFGEYADRFRTRPGGYTRVVKAGRRPGDNADMAVIQLVEALAAAEAEAPAAEPEEAPKAKKKAPAKKAADVAAAPAEEAPAAAEEAPAAAEEPATKPEGAE